MVKLNFDGFVKNDTSASFGFVIRDSLGNPIFAATKITGKSKVLIAKAMTLRDGLLAAKHYQFNHISICRRLEGDSKILIDKINDIYSTPWHIKMLIRVIKFLDSSFEVIHFRHALRKVNFVADAIANLGHYVNIVAIWSHYLPFAIWSHYFPICTSPNQARYSTADL